MTATSITEYLEADHRRLDALLVETADALGAGSVAQAARSFALFEEGIEGHINIEERLLLPHLEEATGPGGPCEVMREEHGRILRGVWSIGAQLRGSDVARCLAELDALARLLSAHNVKEEHVLYPAAERILQSLGQREEVLRCMQAEAAVLGAHD